ncbi:hypothetical protein OKW24_001023 [Peribacillus simplex]|uniref:hypothetical protein n=1 Tax=Peribacillus simplex TaxID=1478 RepID=UPI0024E276D0|nr:hypothetical protein [Peribacillus simplex]MDF9759250.1 hypothetical protein [Peribacillus simplex]
MRWDEVQERFPNEWVVLEATKAYSKEGQRFIEEVAVIDSYEDSTKELNLYLLNLQFTDAEQSRQRF